MARPTQALRPGPGDAVCLRHGGRSASVLQSLGVGGLSTFGVFSMLPASAQVLGVFLPLVGLLAGGAALRSLRIDIVFDPLGVRVANYWRTWRIAWERIAAVKIVPRRWFQHWLSYGAWMGLVLEDGSEVAVQALTNSAGGGRKHKEALLGEVRAIFGSRGIPVEVAISSGPPSWIAAEAEPERDSSASELKPNPWKPDPSGPNLRAPAKVRMRSSLSSLEQGATAIGVTSAIVAPLALATGAALRASGSQTLIATPSPWWQILLILTAPFICYGLIRSARMQLRADSERIVIRDLSWVRTFRWSEVDMILVPAELPGLFGPGSLALATRDGQIHGVAASRRLARRKRKRALEQLWLLSLQHDIHWRASELAR